MKRLPTVPRNLFLKMAKIYVHLNYLKKIWANNLVAYNSSVDIDTPPVLPICCVEHVAVFSIIVVVIMTVN